MISQWEHKCNKALAEMEEMASETSWMTGHIKTLEAKLRGEVESVETQAELWKELSHGFRVIENDTYGAAKKMFIQLQDEFTITRKP